MGLIEKFRLKAKWKGRFGLFVRARHSGMSVDEARMNADLEYPLTPADVEFEERQRIAHKKKDPSRLTEELREWLSI